MMTRIIQNHPLWQLLLCLLLALSFGWLFKHEPSAVTPKPSTAKILAVHAHFVPDEELSNHIPSEQGDAVQLPILQGWQKRNLWVRLRIQATGHLWIEMTPPRLTVARLHYQDRDGKWQTQDNGAAIPVTQRAVAVPLNVFTLNLPPGNEHEVWIEIRSRSPLSLSFVLHHPDDFLPVLTHTMMSDVLALGALVVLGVMAFGVSLVERDMTLWLLGCRSVLVGIWTLQQTGLLSQVLPPAWVGPMATEILIVGQLTLIAQLTTSWSYLHGCALPRWGDRIFAFLLLVLLVILALDIVNIVEYPFIATTLIVFNVIGLALTVAISGWLVWQRQIMATVILVTSLVAMFFYFPVVMRLLGIFGQDMVVQRVFSPVPTVVMLVLLFAGAVIQLQRSQRRIQRTAMEAQAQQIVWLEERVAERTAELETAKNLAEQLNAAKSVFLAKVSHELRAPMHTILGYADLATRESMPMRVRHMLQVVQSAGQQLRTQIEDLLDFARLERAQLRLQPEVMPIADLHQMVVELAWLQASDTGNVFEHHLDTALEAVSAKADTRRIQQVLMILLTNAFRYTQAGQVMLRTECVDLNEERVQVRFVVKDTGRGIRPDVLSKIFEAFERGDTLDSEGLGLGLSIAQPLLALMHSHLEVSSQVGIGSSFSFMLELPRVDSTLLTAYTSSMSTPPMPSAAIQTQDWATLAQIAHDADLSALEDWMQSFPELPPSLQQLVWALDFEGIEHFANERTRLG